MTAHSRRGFTLHVADQAGPQAIRGDTRVVQGLYGRDRSLTLDEGKELGIEDTIKIAGA